MADILRGRIESGETAVLVTIHSFTPIFKGKEREIQLGILHDADSRLADALLGVVGKETDLIVDRNQPYGPEDGVTHTLRFHALPLGLLNVMIEIRNDLVRDRSAQTGMARRLAGYLKKALETIDPTDKAVSHA